MPGDRRTPVGRQFDSATRAAAVVRAEEVGDARAASEVGCRPSTIRSWRQRQRARSDRAPSQTTPQTDAAGLRDLAAAARRAERRALRRVDDLLGTDANAARAASAVARDHASRAAQLEADAHAAAEHDQRLRAATVNLQAAEARLFGQLARLFFDATGVGWQQPQQDLLDALLAAFAEAEPGDDGRTTVAIPEAEASAACEAMRATVARDLRPEIEAEIAAQTLTPPLPRQPEIERAPESVEAATERTSEADVLADPGAGVTWDDLPDDWKRRYADDPGLGVYEWANGLRRDQADRQRPAVERRESRWGPVMRRHPGLDGLGW